MLCAHTLRKLRPGTFEQFKEAFRPPEGEAMRGWVRFHMLRGLADENEVVTFGFFDGTLEEMDASQSGNDHYKERLEAIAPYVESVIANGVYEVVVEHTAAGSTA
jgi:heme-degrading monooxygenase HmoA